MSNPLVNIVIKKAGLTPTRDTGKKYAADLGKSIISVDYFEDILSPSVTTYLKISDTANIYNDYQLRGYERLDLEIATSNGKETFAFTDERPLYVTGIQDIMQREGAESFTLVCNTKETFDNELARCYDRYSETKKISEHVKDILQNILKTENIKTIEETSNTYGFMGNLKKPFHTCTWLSPKGVPQGSKAIGTSGSGPGGKAQGTAGYFFYEDRDGFHFRSMTSMVSATVSNSNMDNKNIQTYTYTSVIEDQNSSNKILQYFFSKATDIQKNLRVGMYSNFTFFFNPWDWECSRFHYKIGEEVDSDMGQYSPLPGDDLAKNASRVLTRVGDQGMITKVIAQDSGVKPADMAKSFGRYNLLFTQSLNIVIPVNVTLRVGQLIRIVLPKATATQTESNLSADEESTGNYLIRSLRHHFDISGGTNTTTLNLIRDSYGFNYA